MREFTGGIIALFIGAVIGSAIGWISCYLFIASKPVPVETQPQIAQVVEQQALPAEPQQQEAKTLEVNELRIVGEDGKLCMTIRGSSVMSADYDRYISTMFNFYDPEGRITHVMGTLGSSFMILSKNIDGGDNWSIREPQTTIFARPEGIGKNGRPGL